MSAERRPAQRDPDWDPQPARRPEPYHVHRDEAEVLHVDELEDARIEWRASHRSVGLLGFSWLLVVIAIVAIALLLVAAPRGEAGQRSGSPSQRAGLTAGVQPLPSASRHSASSRPPRPGNAPSGTQQLRGPDGASTAVLPDTSTSVAGIASWFCSDTSPCTRGYPPATLAAAAGPALRVGDWRGRIVRVCAVGTRRCVRVALVDFCACRGRLVDLYRSAFSRLADPRRGVVRVTVSWGGSTATLPPTSTLP